jgi:zinc transporter ZupT
MHAAWAYVLISAACLASLLGGWLVVRYFNSSVSGMRHISGAAAGYLASATIVRILPESFNYGGETMALWAVGGFLLVHAIEHGVTPHFHYGEVADGYGGTASAGAIALLGLSLHSFMDGMTITAAMRAEYELGLLIFIAALLHRVPEGATISSIFLVSGFKARGALFAAGALAAAAFLGAGCQDLFKIPIGPVLAIAAGLGIYVAFTDLLPQAQKEKGWKSTASLAFGVALFLATDYLLPHSHGPAPPESNCGQWGHGRASEASPAGPDRSQ